VIGRQLSVIHETANNPPSRYATRYEAEHHSEGAEQLIAESPDERRDDEIDEEFEQLHASSSSRASATSVEIPSIVTLLRRDD
jgi:hypothetical protein